MMPDVQEFLPNFTLHLDIFWPFCKLQCNFFIIWWPESENHWPWASGH